MMAGCVFWEGAGADLGAFPGVACKTAQTYYVNICATKRQTLKPNCNLATVIFCQWNPLWLRGRGREEETIGSNEVIDSEAHKHMHAHSHQQWCYLCWPFWRLWRGYIPPDHQEGQTGSPASPRDPTGRRGIQGLKTTTTKSMALVNVAIFNYLYFVWRTTVKHIHWV